MMQSSDFEMVSPHPMTVSWLFADGIAEFQFSVTEARKAVVCLPVDCQSALPCTRTWAHPSQL